MNVGFLNGFQKTAYTSGPATFTGPVFFSNPLVGATGLANNIFATFPDQPNAQISTGFTNGTIFGGGFEKIGFFGHAPAGGQGATIDLGVVLSNFGFRSAGTAYTITTSGTTALSGANTLGPTTMRLAGANAQVGTTYTLVIGDASTLVTMNNAGGMTLTIPANASVAYGIGTWIPFYNKGAGTMTLAITTDTLLGTTSYAANKGGILFKLTATIWMVLASA